MRSHELFDPCVNSVCFPDSKSIDEFNLCSKKLDTLLFCIFQSAQLEARCDELLVNPESWKSVASVREVLMDHFKGLELSETEGIHIREMIAIMIGRKQQGLGVNVFLMVNYSAAARITATNAES